MVYKKILIQRWIFGGRQQELEILRIPTQDYSDNRRKAIGMVWTFEEEEEDEE